MAHSDQIRRSKRGAVHDDSVVEEELSIKIPRFEELVDDDEKRSHASSVSPAVGSLSLRRESRGGPDKPAELFRKDLISAMKLADTEQLQQDDYVLISDPWKQEWESGVQVPVNSETIQRNIIIRKIEGNENLHGSYAFKFPKKFLHAMLDENYKQGIHELHETQKLAEQMCRYDLDDLDVIWLSKMNEEREAMGQEPVMEWVMEKVIEEMECQCYNNMQNTIKTVEGLGIEYDENVVCDVCRSPEGEDNNEIVFCDGCDICVHQACYGIQKIPEGSWLCRTCALGIQPKCILCPKTGGAMKSTKSGTKWAHVSCALWIPEVSIGCPEKMEPVTKISQIPSSRWSLICNVCRERSGACIQCSVKTCKTAFHVTCAFNNNLNMKTMLDEDHDDVQLKAFCSKHSGKKKEGDVTPRKEPSTPKRDLILKRDPSTPTKKESEMTEEEKTELRSHRLGKLAEEFYACVEVSEVAEACKMDEETIDFIFNYWVLKRKSNFNKPLLTPKTEEADLLLKQREDSLVARMKMFIHLRQDLERVRNLCYMVSKREKIRRQLYSMKEEIFHQQVVALKKLTGQSHTREFSTIATAHKEPLTLYDQYDDILRTAKITEGQARLQDDLTSEREESEPPPDILPKHKRVGKSKRRLAFHQAAQGKRSKPEPVKVDSDTESQTGSSHSCVGRPKAKECGEGDIGQNMQCPNSPYSSEDEMEKHVEIPKTEPTTCSSQEDPPPVVQSLTPTDQPPPSEGCEDKAIDIEALSSDTKPQTVSVGSKMKQRSPRQKRLSLRRSLRAKDNPPEETDSGPLLDDSAERKSDGTPEKCAAAETRVRRSLRTKDNMPEEADANPASESKPDETVAKPVQGENHLRRSLRTKDNPPEEPDIGSPVSDPSERKSDETPEKRGVVTENQVETPEKRGVVTQNQVRRSLRTRDNLQKETEPFSSGDDSSDRKSDKMVEEHVTVDHRSAAECSEVKDPEVDDKPVAIESPGKVETPVAIESPVKVETPVAMESPAKVETSVAMESPVEEETPVAMESPVKVETPVAMESPVNVETPVAMESPVKVETPVAMESPVKVDSPARTESPSEKECPVVVEDSTITKEHTTSTVPAVETKNKDSTVSPRKVESCKNRAFSETSDATDTTESGVSPRKRTRRSMRRTSESTPKVNKESISKLGGNGTSLPQVEVSVDESSGKISLRVRNHSEPKLRNDKSRDTEKDSPQKTPALGSSRRTLHRHSLESAVITSGATAERKSQTKVPRRSSSRLQSLGVNGLVSPSQLIVKQDIKDKVHSYLGRLRPGRLNHNHIQNGILDSSERKMDKLLATRRSSSGMEEGVSEEILEAGRGLTKENNPSNVSILSKFQPIGIELSSPEMSNNSRGLASPKSELASPGACRSPVPGDPASGRSSPERRIRRRLHTSGTANLGEQPEMTEDRASIKSNSGSVQHRRRSSHMSRSNKGRFVRVNSARSSVSSVINISDSEDSVNLVSDIDSEYAPSENSDSSVCCRSLTRKRTRVLVVDDVSMDSTHSSVRSSSRLSQNFSKVIGSSGS